MTAITTKQKFLGLAAWLVVSFAASAVGAVATICASEFYGELMQPAWAPPAAVFGPVWTVLYALMGIAVWLVWQSGGLQKQRVDIALFLAQLAVNALWSWLFFAWSLGALAFIDILFLIALVVATIVCFWRVRPLAGLLLVPYLLWISFAAALNYSIWHLNPQVLG